MPFTALPVSLLLDDLLPVLPLASLLALSSTCKDLYDLVHGDQGDILWRRKIEAELHFPVASTGRKGGWEVLFKRLKRPGVYLWGDGGNGRLSVLPLPGAADENNWIMGGLCTPTRLPLDLISDSSAGTNSTVVSLEAGGWAFHALRSDGNVAFWGQMNGETWAPEGTPLQQDGVVVRRPLVLLSPAQLASVGGIRQLEQGRRHAVARTEKGKVLEWWSWGSVLDLRDADGRWGIQGASAGAVSAISAGWGSSACLTASGRAFIWFEPPPARVQRALVAVGEMGQQAKVVGLEVDSLELPPLPVAEGDISRGQEQGTIELLASGDGYIHALSRTGVVYSLDISALFRPGQGGEDQNDPEDSPARGRAAAGRGRLDAAFRSGERSWIELKKFCEVEEIARLPYFAGAEGAGGGRGVEDGTRISHISAHFHHFVTYAVPTPGSTVASSSIVLIGTEEQLSSHGAETTPTVVPEVQGRGVIKVAIGDWHKVALTATGELLSWGEYSKGALGLGNAALPNTPLGRRAAARSTVAPPRQQQQPGGLQRIFPPFPFAPTPAPRAMAENDSVEQPMRVVFPGEAVSDEGEAAGRKVEERTEGMFVFSLAAAGWHTGALAVELGDEEHLDSSATASASGEEDEHDEGTSMPGAFSFPSNSNPPRTIGDYAARGAGRGGNDMLRGRGIRIGYAARGMRRPPGGPPPPPPS